MSSIRIQADNTAEKEAINIFNKYLAKNNENKCETLKQLATDGYNGTYFRKTFSSCLWFLHFFKIESIDFEKAGWVKWSFLNIEKGEDFSEEEVKRLQKYFGKPFKDNSKTTQA